MDTFESALSSSKGWPSLVLDDDGERDAKARTFAVKLTEPPDWDDLQLKPNVEVLKVKGSKDIDTRKTMLQLVIAIQSQQQVEITKIEFRTCVITELGHWCVVMQRQQQQHDQENCMTLAFYECDIELGAAISLSCMLEANIIGGLSFKNCTFKDDSANWISAGLRINKSLQKLDFEILADTEPKDNLMSGIPGMLSVNQKIVNLGVDMRGENCWDIYRAAESHPLLETLHLYNATLDVPSMGAIMKLYQDSTSLTSLMFNSCSITHGALQLLTEQLSKYVELRSLSFEFCSVNEPTNSEATSSRLKWSGVNVNCFGLTQTKFGNDESIASFLDEVAMNTTIEYMDLCNVLDTEQDVRKLCDAFFLQNRGPPYLTIDQRGIQVSMIVEALQENTRVVALTLASMDAGGHVACARGLANMRALRNLFIGFHNYNNAYTPEFFQALQDSLESNTALSTLAIRGIDADNDMAKPFLPMIRYLIAINRIGRQSLLAANTIPTGLWAYILARCSTDPDGIYFALKGKPEICPHGNCKHAGAKKRIRKRKNRKPNRQGEQ